MGADKERGMDAGTTTHGWIPHPENSGPWVLETPDGRAIEGCGVDGREARRFPSSGAALAFAAAQGEPWKSGCVARNVGTGEVNGPARVATNAESRMPNGEGSSGPAFPIAQCLMPDALPVEVLP